MKNMKTFLIVAFAFITFGNMNAQQSLINFQEDNILINGISKNVGNTMLKGEVKKIKKLWLSFIKEQLNENMKETKQVLSLKKLLLTK